MNAAVPNAEPREAALGDNQPPALALTPEQLQADLEERYGALVKRVLDRRAGALKVEEVNAENAETVQDFLTQLAADKAEVEAKRVHEKKPHDDRAGVVQTFFKKGLLDKIDAESARLNKLKVAYQKRLADEEAAEQKRKLAAAEAEKKRLADEEAAARKAAEDAMAKGDREGAKAALEQVDATHTARQAVAEQAAQVARAAPTGAIRGTYGNSSLTAYWNFEIVDVAAMKPEELWPYIEQDALERAIRGFIAAKAPPAKRDAVCPPLAGVRIFPDFRSTNRRA